MHKHEWSWSEAQGGSQKRICRGCLNEEWVKVCRSGIPCSECDDLFVQVRQEGKENDCSCECHAKRTVGERFGGEAVTR